MEKIKIKLNEYVSRETLHKIDARYIILIGGRNNGKSFATKEEVIRNALDKGEEFAYIRRYKEDCKQYMVTEYFSDIICDKDGNNHLMEWSGGKYNTVVTYNQGIYFGFLDEETGKVEKGQRFGRMFGLSWATHYKSLSFPQITTAVYEEFITEGEYLKAGPISEPKIFMNLISTIFRDRKGKVFLVGNTVSRINPFFKEWQLKGVPKQQPNSIEYYSYKYKSENGKEELARIACYMTHSREKNSGMFFGNAAKTITETVWETEESDTLTVDKRKCNVIHNVVMKYDDNMFLMEFLELPDGVVAWYVSPKTTPIKPDTRVVSNELILSELATRSFIGLSEKEAQIFKYLKDDRVLFSDNLTATEFKQCYGMMRKVIW